MKSELPKVLHSVLGRPICAYPTQRALSLGAERVVAVVGHQAERVEASLKSLFPKAPLGFALQAQQRGTADAVRSAEAAMAGFNGRVLILYGDTPLLREETLAQLLAEFDRGSGPLAMISTFPADPTGYGRVLRDANGVVTNIVEHKDATPAQRETRECNAGIYVADSDFLWRALKEIKNDNAQGEFYLTDLVVLASREGPVATIPCEFAETAGVNDRVELAAAAKVMQTRLNTAHMKNGVSLQDPATAYIEEGVEIGADTEIAPNVHLGGGTRIGRNVVIGTGCVFTGTTVADGVKIKPYSLFEDSIVGERSLIGPFARLRPGTELAEDVHIGNFVETKKTRVGRGSKANHLAYLGDAKIGSGVNVGAGTITCNYDGVNKHETVLGDGVFIGSDTQLVAPVKVGDGAYVGAGTTVTKDVPPGSLATSRTPQKVTEGWAERKKARQAGKGGGGEGSKAEPEGGTVKKNSLLSPSI